MQQDPNLHQHPPQLQWDPLKMQATLRNADSAFTYVLLTNSVRLNSMDGVLISQFCKDCKQNINCIIFSIKIDNITKQILASQMKDFQYCVLPFKGKQCRFQEVIGHKSTINDKRHSIITNNLIINSEKSIKQPQQVDRTLFCTSASSKASESVEDPIEDLSSSVVFSLQKQQEIIENYELYVTKLQRDVGEGYRSYMFYQYAWTEAEIQEIMNKIDKYFGSIHAFIPKRRYLRFTFARNKHDYLFKNKFDAIERQLLFKNNIKLQGNILNYYLISKQQPLPNQEQTGKLFLLPNNESITDMLIANNWIVVSAQTYIMFVHSQRPMEYFHHEEKVYCTQLAPKLNNDKVLFATDKRGFIYCFQLQEVKVILRSKLNVSFVTPYSLVHLQTGMAIAGIDTDQSKKTSRRSIFIIKGEGKPEKKDKHLPIQTRLEVIVFQGENKVPIRNIKSTKEKDVIACTWSNKFFLVSLQGFKLIEVELSSTISKLTGVPFLFNHLNFMILLNNGDIVRVGIECYGQGLGAELCQLNATRALDCILVSSEGSKFELYGCKGNKIDKISYLNDNKQRFLYEENGKIVKLASTKDGIAYLLDLDHSIQLKYLQI